jgi:replication factor A1
MDISKVVDRIMEAYGKYDVKREEIEKKLKLMIEEFRVPEREAITTVINWIKREYEISEPLILAEQKNVEKLAECREGEFVNLEVKVVQLWEPRSPSIKQAGLVGDETGIVKFVTWKKAEKVPMLEEGKCYALKNVAVSFYRDRPQVQLNTYTVVEEIEKDIRLPSKDVEFVAPIVHVLGNSGLIQRCPECRRVVSKNTCPIHGKISPLDDLRVKAVFDDGRETYNAILDENAISSLTGIDLEKARQMAQENLSRESVLDELVDKLVGRYYKVKGRVAGDWIIVEQIDFAKLDSVEGLIREAIA